MTPLLAAAAQLLAAMVVVGAVALLAAAVRTARADARDQRVWTRRLVLADHRRAVTPDRCRACGTVGWHDQGCGLLDQLDAGQVPA